MIAHHQCFWCNWLRCGLIRNVSRDSWFGRWLQYFDECEFHHCHLLQKRIVLGGVFEKVKVYLLEEWNWYRLWQTWGIGILDWSSLSWFLEKNQSTELGCRSTFHCHQGFWYCSRWKSDKHWSHLSWELQSISSPYRHIWGHCQICSQCRFCFLGQ